ncbi:protein trichome birefringence-like 34 [Typha latifolia]|uniref:protein trichome birefringence-like 34 n=1 Tax=Typha latifolia TaxID=4733 RepID=UPI003C30831B
MLLLAVVFMVIIFALSFSAIPNKVGDHGYVTKVADDELGPKCDLFVGNWVYDDSNHPLYSGLACPFMIDEVACDKYGRNDVKYQQWRWQPHGCDLPRFDAKKLLNRLRNQRLVFVGDSLNRNQWLSFVCMVESSISHDQKNITQKGSLRSFKAQEYNATIDFYWSPLLVESNCDHPINHRVSSRIMRANSIEAHAKNWRNADILVFNSYLWWKKPRMKMKVMYNSFDEQHGSYQEVEMVQAFELALKTWSDWLQLNKESTGTQLYYVSLSPTHVWGEEWGMPNNHNCYNESEPINIEGYTGRGSDYTMMRIVESTVENLRNKGLNVKILNITQLSEYRKDGHPSIYRKQWDTLSEDQLADPTSYADCTHWCLPGVPDVWNELLYTYIISNVQILRS